MQPVAEDRAVLCISGSVRHDLDRIQVDGSVLFCNVRQIAVDGIGREGAPARRDRNQNDFRIGNLLPDDGEQVVDAAAMFSGVSGGGFMLRLFVPIIKTTISGRQTS